MKRKPIILFLVSFLMIGTAVAQNRSIEFIHKSFADVLAKAKAENKFVFFDAYTSWCGPCKYMASKVFTQDSVADFVNKHFISTKVDMEKGEGPELLKRYNVECFPTFLVMDCNGNVMHRFSGAYDAADFITKANAGMSEETSLAGCKKRYDNGCREAEFIVRYVDLLDEAYLPNEKDVIVKNYFTNLNDSVKFSASAWKVYEKLVTNPFGKLFKDIVTNREKFITANGESVVNAKLFDVLQNGVMSMLSMPDPKYYQPHQFNNIKELINLSKLKETETEGLAAIMAIAEAKVGGKYSIASYTLIAGLQKGLFDTFDKQKIVVGTLAFDEKKLTTKDKLGIKKFFEKELASATDGKYKKTLESLIKRMSSKQ